jgi:hypothetical protein
MSEGVAVGCGENLHDVFCALHVIHLQYSCVTAVEAST